MLVLSRKTQESIVVGGTDHFERMITITVLDIKGGKVRLGIEADADVPVHRSEVWEQIVAAGLPNGQRAGPAAPCA